MSKLITYRQALNEAFKEEMRRDPNVFVYGLDVPDHIRIFGSTAGLLEEFGEKRCFGTPLSEEALTGMAVGAALNGLRPILVHIRADFLLLTMNQIANMLSTYQYLTVGKVKMPVVIRALIGRGWGQGAQHSKSIQSLFAHFPGIKVIMPTTPADAKGLMKSAIREENPVIVLEHRWLYDTTEEVAEEEYLTPIGQPKILKEGKDVTIVATSWMNIEALKAHEILEKRDISVEIIDPRTISPLDFTDIFTSVRKTGHCIIADYDWLNCGFSAEVAAQISEHCFNDLKSPISRLGFAPSPCPTTRPLENLFYANAKDIVEEIEKKLRLSPTDLSQEIFYSYENLFKGPF